MKNYKIAVAGTGYVGLSLGVLLSQHHQVVAVDIVQAKVDMIIVNETNLGLGPALAKGIENSKNELIARMDSDDYVVSTRCERQLEKFREDPKLGMVGSYEAEFVDDIDNVISIHRVPSENDEIERFMHRRCSVLHPTVMYKKSAVLKSGNYQSVLLYEDYSEQQNGMLMFVWRAQRKQVSIFMEKTLLSLYQME